MNTFMVLTMHSASEEWTFSYTSLRVSSQEQKYMDLNSIQMGFRIICKLETFRNLGKADEAA